jgi:lipopolysaccharide transport system permease protein
MPSISLPRVLRNVVATIGALVSVRANTAATINALRIFRRHRALALELARRDLGSQFQGQALGSFWVIGHPLVLLLIYIFVFVAVFKIRIPSTTSISRDYAAYILAGLVPWLAIQQSLVRGANTLLAQSNLVRQVVFPIEILPLNAVLVSMVAEMVGLAIIFLYALIRFGDVPWTFLLLPVAIGLQVIMMTGIAFVLAVITPFVRDIREFISVLTVIGVYIIPAFYLPDWITGTLKVIVTVNPFSHVIWVFQDVLYFGSIEHPYSWFFFAGMSVVSFVLGFRIFIALKPYVANVL